MERGLIGPLSITLAVVDQGVVISPVSGSTILSLAWFCSVLADITYIATGEGWLYLAAVLNLATRKIVGWAMRDDMRTELPLAAMMMAAQRQRPGHGLICHSDRGSQYAAGAYVDHLAAIGATPSRSNSSISVDRRPRTKRGWRCSDTSKAITTGTACTRPWGI